MPNKVKRSPTIPMETDYEIRRLAKLWDVPIIRVWEICCHYTARQACAHYKTAKRIADIRQAEAKVEMLKSSN